MATGITILAASALPLVGLVAAFRRKIPGVQTGTNPHPRQTAAMSRIERGISQLRAVEATSFQTVPLLPAAAARFLPLIEAVLIESYPDLRVMAQANLGELICPTGGTEAEAAYTAICTKQLQFAIINPNGILICALDCPAAEPYRSASSHRDAVKRRALDKAGVPQIDLPADADFAFIGSQFHAVLGDPSLIRTAAE
jgi:hypothetical protein